MKYATIAALIRNEAHYLEEWLKFHIHLGIEHFYLYNNNDQDDGTLDILSKYHSYITLREMKGIKQQTNAVMHCIDTHKDDAAWMCVIDADEFIVPRFGLSVPALLKSFEEFSALCPHWYIFGSNGHTKYEAKPVIERFTKRASEVDRHIKSIVNPKKVIGWVSAHKFTMTSPAVDEHYNYIDNFESRPEPATADIVAINHYVCKSLEECYNRRSRARADTGEVRQMPHFFDGHNRNDVEDLTAFNIWKSIK